MRAWDHFQSRFSFRQGPALAGFLSVTLWLFQVVLVQPMFVCWLSAAQESESESRCETEEVDCPVQLTSRLRHRSRQAVPLHARPVARRISPRSLMVAPVERQCTAAAGNPAWCCPLRC